MCPIFADEGPFPEPLLFRAKHAADPADNLVRNDLAVALYLGGEEEEAASILAGGPSAGPGRSLIRINRFFLEWARSERENFAKLRTWDPWKKIKRISPPERSGRPPLVSVIMPTYNRGESVLPAVQSVLRQEFTDFELIVVNDGGDLAVEGVLKKLDSPKLVFVDAEHQGLHLTLNLGLYLARGKYIARLDDDDLHTPDHLRLTVAELERDPKCEMVYTDLEIIEQEKRGSEYVTVRKIPALVPDWDAAVFRRRMFFNPANVLHTRTLLDRMGPYMDFPTRADWEFFLRMSSFTPFRHLPKVTLSYFLRTDQSNLSRQDPLRFNAYTNLIGYIHRIYAITSSLWLPFGQTDRRIQAVIASLDRLLDGAPNVVRGLKLRALAELQRHKPYTWFYDLARELERHPEYEDAARIAWREALRLGPGEPKIYFRYLRSRSGNRRQKKHG